MSQWEEECWCGKSEGEEKERAWPYRSFEELMKESDVISVHVPLNDDTRHLLNERTMGLCKKGVIIVNTARGAVIDEAALVKKLDEGHVASAGLDVYENEPEVHEGLRRNERCLLLPHMGTWTYETQEDMEKWCVDNLARALAVEGHCSPEASQEEKDKVKCLREMSVVPEQRDMKVEKIKELEARVEGAVRERVVRPRHDVTNVVMTRNDI